MDGRPTRRRRADACSRSRTTATSRTVSCSTTDADDEEAARPRYATRRMRWEPIYRRTQPKGDGESIRCSRRTSRQFRALGSRRFGPVHKTRDMLPRSTRARRSSACLPYDGNSALTRSSSASSAPPHAHTGLATTTEDNFFGDVRHPRATADPIRFDEVIIGRGPEERPRNQQHLARETSASGLRPSGRATTRAKRCGTRWRRHLDRVQVDQGPGSTCVGQDARQQGAHDVGVVRRNLQGRARTGKPTVKLPPAGATTVNVTGRELHERHRRAVPDRVLEGSGFRSEAARVLLRAGARDPRRPAGPPSTRRCSA